MKDLKFNNDKRALRGVCVGVSWVQVEEPTIGHIWGILSCHTVLG